jgi:acetoacetyl-CoA synthetase
VFDLSALRAVLSTGSILYPRQYDWVAHHVKATMPLQSISGGTDIIGCLVLGNPNLPVHRGEVQCRSLGLDVRALPPADDPRARIGELVCANPFPSRPLGFHRDTDGSRFHQTYFAQNPGFWTHGDLIEVTPHGGWRLHGRSDGVLNVRGIRIGTAEIYRILGDVVEILEAMAVEQRAEHEPGGSRIVLLLVLRPGVVLDGALARRIRSELARCGSPAFVPARIVQVAALPVTFNGKRSEAAARDAVNGLPVRNHEALQNPDCLDAIANHPALAPSPKSSAAPPESTAGSLFENRDRLCEELQAICERVLDLSPIGWSDNLLELGVDSLALVNLLLEIERRTGRRLSLPGLLAGPSIDEMARTLLLGSDGEKLRTFPRSGPRVRPARPEDREEIYRFLESAFPRSGIEASGWGRLLDHNWSDHERGFVLLDGKAVVGFIGTIIPRRRINGAETLVCNLSSWAVHPKYRGHGMALLAEALRDESVAYTSFTPSETTWAALHAQGFVQLESHMIVMPLLAQAGSLLARTRPVISFDPAAVRPKLSDQQKRIFDDHAPYDCLQLLVEEGDERAYVVVKRRVHRPVGGARLGRLVKLLPVRFVYSDILHCSSPELLARHLERVKLAILRRQRTAALAAEARLFPVRPRGMLFPRRTCYRSHSLWPGDVDRLYSEFVLLPLEF